MTANNFSASPTKLQEELYPSGHGIAINFHLSKLAFLDKVWTLTQDFQTTCGTSSTFWTVEMTLDRYPFSHQVFGLAKLRRNDSTNIVARASLEFNMYQESGHYIPVSKKDPIMLSNVKSAAKMTALKFLISCFFIIIPNMASSGGDDAFLPPRHVSEFSDPVSGFNPFVDLEEGFLNDSRPSIDRKLMENPKTNLLSAISMTGSGRGMADFFNENEKSKISNVGVYNSINKTETIIKKLQAKQPQQVTTPSVRHLRIHDLINNEESNNNKIIPEEAQEIQRNIVRANNESETTGNTIAINNDITENENDNLEILNYMIKCKKSGLLNYRMLRNRKRQMLYKNSDIKIHFPAIINSYSYTIYVIVCTIVIIFIILYVSLSLKRSPLWVKQRM